MKAIAIGTNIPYDLLDAVNSNRSVSEVAMERLNNKIVIPMQRLFLKQLREALFPYFGKLVEWIDLHPVDTKNQKEEMDILT